MSKQVRRKPVSKEWMRPADAAKLLEVTRPTIINRALKGEYRTLEIGGITFVSRKDVERAKAVA